MIVSFGLMKLETICGKQRKNKKRSGSKEVVKSTGQRLTGIFKPDLAGVVVFYFRRVVAGKWAVILLAEGLFQGRFCM